MSCVSVKWYDGKHPLPHILTLDLRAEQVMLNAGDGSSTCLEWGALRRSDAPDRVLRFQVPAVWKGDPPGMLEIERAVCEKALGALPEAEAARMKKRLGMHRRKTRTSTWILISAMVIPLCWFVYTGLAVEAHRLVPVEKEMQWGLAVRNQFLLWRTPVANQEEDDRAKRLERWLEILRPENSPYRYEITLIDTPHRNAAAAPGGQIFVFTGLFEGVTDAELMGVLAHEIAHVELRHSVKSLLRSMGVMAFMSAAIGGGFETLEGLEIATELTGILVLLSYSREMELEADAWAVRRLLEVQMDPNGLVRFLERLQREQNRSDPTWKTFLSTHPASPERIERLREMTQ